MLGAGEIAFVQQNHICIAQLIGGGLTVEKVQTEITGIGHGNNRIDAKPVAKFRPQESQNYWERISQSAALDHQMIYFMTAFQHPKDCIHEIVVKRATDAAVGQFEHCIVARDNEVAVEPDLVDFIDHHCNADSRLARKDVVQQCGLAAAEKPGNDRDGKRARVSLALTEGAIAVVMPTALPRNCKSCLLRTG